MPYAIRNSIILGVLLILVFIGGMLSNSQSVKRFEKIEKVFKENSHTLNQLKKTNPDLERTDEIIASLEEMKKKALENNKIILKKDNPSQTYQYLIDITETFTPGLNFDFKVAQGGKKGDIHFNSYTLNGSGNIELLHFFLYQLEYQAPLYVIESMRISETSVALKDTVDFSMKLSVFYDKKTGTSISEIPFRSFSYSNLTYNPFYSQIHAPLDRTEEEKYININSSVIIGLTPDKVFLRDMNGLIVTLVPGSRVAYGYLNYINWKQQCAVFNINRIGINQEVKMYLQGNEL
ncbi:MAG: hypothetical protein J7M10_03035 [Candidatus Cloacimonetes bacterium]|nr:hypothetical protein [Candidatus Cloacimonadota bacterium]